MISSSRQLKDKVRNISDGNSNKATTLIRNFMMERFLERVSISSYRDNFILKGGMLVAAIVGVDMRATMDIDTTVKALPLNEADVQRIIEEICNIPLEDNVSFQIKSTRTIMEEFDYLGIRVMLEATLDRMRQPIKIDISTDDVWPDELFILQQRNSAIIYSGETALYLHGLTDREYSSICVTVPQGYNASHLKDNDVVVSVRYVGLDFYKIGICEISSSSGNKVKVYDKERCICDLIMNRNKYEVQVFQTAIKEYMSSKDKKLSQLIVYADKMGIRDEVMKYVEVLV